MFTTVSCACVSIDTGFVHAIKASSWDRILNRSLPTGLRPGSPRTIPLCGSTVPGIYLNLCGNNDVIVKHFAKHLKTHFFRLDRSRRKRLLIYLLTYLLTYLPIQPICFTSTAATYANLSASGSYPRHVMYRIPYRLLIFKRRPSGFILLREHCTETVATYGERSHARNNTRTETKEDNRERHGLVISKHGHWKAIPGGSRSRHLEKTISLCCQMSDRG